MRAQTGFIPSEPTRRHHWTRLVVGPKRLQCNTLRTHVRTLCVGESRAQHLLKLCRLGRKPTPMKQLNNAPVLLRTFVKTSYRVSLLPRSGNWRRRYRKGIESNYPVGAFVRDEKSIRTKPTQTSTTSTLRIEPLCSLLRGRRERHDRNDCFAKADSASV
jgi:hypothetical protein